MKTLAKIAPLQLALLLLLLLTKQILGAYRNAFNYICTRDN